MGIDFTRTKRWECFSLITENGEKNTAHIIKRNKPCTIDFTRTKRWECFSSITENGNKKKENGNKKRKWE